MAIGLIGRKCGMTRVFTEDGVSVPVTVVDVQPNRIVSVKTDEKDGYRAIQITTGTKPASKINKPLAGHFAKAGVVAGRGLWEFRLEGDEGQDIAVGTELKADIFKVGMKVDVTSNSKGKGFAGTVKRHNFRMQDATHGNSLSHRAPGSIGQCQDPGRVFKGKKMAGHLGNISCTIQNQEVIRVDVERNLLLLKGVVSGAPGVDVMIKPAVKGRGATNEI